MLRLAQHDDVMQFVTPNKPALRHPEQASLFFTLNELSCCHPEQREGSNLAGLSVCPGVLTYKVLMLRLGTLGPHYTSDLMIQTLAKPRTSTL